MEGAQRAIMLQYLDGQLVTPCNRNFTSSVAEKALLALQSIHELGICHGDVYCNRYIRNLMLLQNGDVAWIDFEHSVMAEKAHQWLSLEKEVVEELMGKDGRLRISMHRWPISASFTISDWLNNG
jgi:RIO-like serine/threonine protein kinase